jgi:hypothetical protein
MKKRSIGFTGLFLALMSQMTFGQSFTPSSNQSYVALEKNMLFNATSRYTVTQSGFTAFDLPGLFDGSFFQQYQTGFNGDAGKQVVIEISGLPATHTQVGGLVGFTSRALAPKRFKIEAYDVYVGFNNWRTVADVTGNTKDTFSAPVSGEITKLRFTFFEGFEPNSGYPGWIGLSELFFLHGEAASAYDGLMVRYDAQGNVGVGTPDPKGYKLAVNGKVRAQEIKVEAANWPDYVFAKDYVLPSLKETEKHIQDNGHLPGIPSAAEVKSNGMDLGEMNAKLLQKN